MMLDKIGIIGKTQGVRGNNEPATKKPEMTNHKLPDFKTRVVLSVSFSLVNAVLVKVFVPLSAVGKSTKIVFLIGA